MQAEEKVKQRQCGNEPTEAALAWSDEEKEGTILNRNYKDY